MSPQVTIIQRVAKIPKLKKLLKKEWLKVLIKIRRQE